MYLRKFTIKTLFIWANDSINVPNYFIMYSKLQYFCNICSYIFLLFNIYFKIFKLPMYQQYPVQYIYNHLLSDHSLKQIFIYIYYLSFCYKKKKNI